jgi:hypothetical protein
MRHPALQKEPAKLQAFRISVPTFRTFESWIFEFIVPLGYEKQAIRDSFLPLRLKLSLHKYENS